MKLSVNPGHWSSVDPGVMKLIRELGCASGTRAGGQAIDAAWWNTAELPAPQAPSRFAFERGYSSRSTEMVAWAFEDLLQLQMGLGAWKARGNTRPMSLCVVPFLFEVDGGLRWKMLRATEGELLIGNAPHFMQFWEGGALDDQGKAYHARANTAFEAMLADRFSADSDAAAGEAALAAQLCMHGLLWEAWEQCRPVFVSFG